MRTVKMLLVMSLCCGVVLTGCTHFKGGKQQGVTQTTGLGEEDGFAYEEISTVNRLKAPYNQTYHFALNKYDITPDDAESIEVQAEYLVTHPHAKVRLEGNCDERGSREYNIALGWKRAKAVAEILREQGVRAEQIVLLSYGKEKPVAFGHDEESHRKNRRTDLFYEAK